MKKLIPLVLLIGVGGACHRAPAPAPTPVPATPPATGNLVGASDARAAVDGFIGAAKAQNLQALSALWGTPAALVRERDPQEDVEKRILTMFCYLKHDRYQVLRENPAPGGARTFLVEFGLGDLTRSSNFLAVSNTSGRWFVQEFELEPLTALCQRR